MKKMITLVLGLALLASVTPVEANDEFAPSWRSFPDAVSVKLDFNDPNNLNSFAVSGLGAGSATVTVPEEQLFGESSCVTSSGGVVHSGGSRITVTNLADPNEGVIVRVQITTNASPLEVFTGMESATGLFGSEEFEGCVLEEGLEVVESSSLGTDPGFTTYYYEAILTDPGECDDIHFFIEGGEELCFDEVILDVHFGINPGQKVVSNIEPASITLTEGTNTTMVVSLDGSLDPAGNNVNVLLNPENSATDITFNGSNPYTLTFTPGNWTTPQTVTVAATTGNFEMCVESFSFQAQVSSATSSFDGGASQSALNITVNEIDSGCVIVSGAAELEEITGGATGTLVYSLNRVPISGTISVDLKDSFEDPNLPFFTVDPNVVVFNTSNWATPQTVTLTAIQDDVLRGPGNGDLTETTIVSTVIAVGDSFFTENPAAISVTIAEDECGALELNPFDFDQDCNVDISDLSSFVESWLNCTTPGC